MRRRALLIGVPGGGINVTLAAERLTPLLSELGFNVARCIGGRANRDAVLEALDRLVSQTGPDDTCFVHYFGHGGRIEFTDLEGPFAGTIFGFVSTIKESRGGGGFAGVLDVELSARFTRLDEICANVTVMLDCCYSAELVRATNKETGTETPTALSSYYKVPTPNLVRELLAQPQRELALESHPRIVRLCGASARREAFATLRHGRNIGHMTDSFVNILSERGPEQIARLSWGALIHDLRERVIQRLQFEGQWVALAGPRNRLLFSREQCEFPGTVSVTTAAAEPGWVWLRAGWQQGVTAGDRWAVLDARVDDEGRARVAVEGVVREVERNRSRVELAGSAELPLGSPAQPAAIAAALGVACDGAHVEALERSAWLVHAAGEQAEAALRSSEAGFVVEDLRGVLPPVTVGELDRALDLLEQRARVRVLLRSLSAHEPDPHPLEHTCMVVGGQTLEAGAQLRAGDRIRIEIHNPQEKPPHNWFFSAVLIEGDGRPRLLNARMPEGLEICPLAHEQLGVRAGQERQGFELRWPVGVEADSTPLGLLFLVSRRVLPLGHIVREQLLDEDEALALSGVVDAARAIEPSPTPACAWQYLEFSLSRS